jgi:hypothetical protein
VCSITNEVEHNQWNDAWHHTGSHKVVTSKIKSVVNAYTDQIRAKRNNLLIVKIFYGLISCQNNLQCAYHSPPLGTPELGQIFVKYLNIQVSSF